MSASSLTDKPAFARQALEHASRLANLYPRGSATAGEARAAAYVQQVLGDLGIQEVQKQAFQGLRSIWLFLSLAFGAALAGHAAFWLLRRSLGGLSADLVSLMLFGWAALLLWRKFTFRSTPLAQSIPHGPSQNIVARLPAAGEARRKLVLVAHLDCHRAVWTFASDLLLRLYGVVSPLSIYGVFLAPLLYWLSLLPGLGLLAWPGLVLAVPQFLGWFTGMTADLGPYSPGANDNASAVGALLAQAERLRRQPLQHTETWLVFSGCEESGCDGMRFFLERYAAELKDALFIDLELVGIGQRLAYLGSEGVVRRLSIPRVVENLLQAASGIHPLVRLEFTGGAFTEMGAIWERGLAGACLMMLPQESSLPPEWHRLTDLPERLHESAFEALGGYLDSLLQRFDRLGI